MTEKRDTSGSENSSDAIQYLTFKLDDDAFAIEIIKVREVLEHTEVTKVPRTPEYMRGVINLRGNIVPVVDLRLQFGMEPGEITVDTCIIIVEVEIDGHTTVLGALADSVQEVIDMDRKQMEPAPSLGTRVDNRYIQAMGKADDGSFIIMLNMDKVFSVDQLQEVEKSSGENGDSDTEAA